MTVAEMTAPASTPALRLALPANAENIAVIRQALGGMAAELGADPELIDDIKTAVSEAATNAVVHAYPEGEGGPIEVLATARGSQFEVVVRDRGVGMQPRPLEPQEPSLRVGLALIGALADQVEIRGEQGAGTELKIGFDLERQDDPLYEAGEPETVGVGQTRIAIEGSETAGAAIPKVLELLAARSDLDLDRLGDAQLVGDFLSSAASTIDSKPLEVSISELDNAIEIRVGPLEPGLGEKMLRSGDLPGYGNTLESVADRTEVTTQDTDKGPADFLILEIATKAR